MAESEVTQSCLGDFSKFHPAGFPKSTDSTHLTSEVTIPSKTKAKVAWFNRKSKGGGWRRGVYEHENELQVSRRNTRRMRSSQANRNSLPSDLSLLGSSVLNVSSDCSRASCTDGMEVEKELQLLTGFSNKQRVLVSPARCPESAKPFFNPERDVPDETVVCEPANHAVSPLVQSPVSVVPFVDPCVSSPFLSRQGSFEYDHLEDFDPVVDNQKRQLQNDSYVVAVQLKKEEKCDVRDLQESARPIQPIPVSAAISASIPDHLNFDVDTIEVNPRRPLFQWNSVSVLPTKDIPERPCHCPSCCSCGSSQRRLSSSVRTGCETRLPFLASRFLEPVNGSLSRQGVCPLKRYGSDKSFARQHIPLKSISPLIQPRLGVVEQNKLPSATGYGSDQVAFEESTKSTSFGVSGLLSEPDSQSVNSMFSTQSCATTATSSICWDHHIPYNKGVSGNIFKDRMEVC